MCEILLYLHKHIYPDGFLNKIQCAPTDICSHCTVALSCVTHSGKLFNYKNGLGLREISQSMTENIVTLQSFKKKLIEDNKSHTTAINTIFRTHLTM